MYGSMEKERFQDRIRMGFVWVAMATACELFDFDVIVKINKDHVYRQNRDLNNMKFL